MWIHCPALSISVQVLHVTFCQCFPLVQSIKENELLKSATKTPAAVAAATTKDCVMDDVDWLTHGLNVEINAAAGNGAAGVAADDDMQIDSSSKGTRNDVGASTEGGERGSEAEAGAGAADTTVGTARGEASAVTERGQPCLGAVVTAHVSARRSLLPCLQAAALEATATEDAKKAAFYKTLYEINPVLTPANVMVHYGEAAAGGTLCLKCINNTALPDALSVSLEEVGFSSIKLEKFVRDAHRKIEDCCADSSNPVIKKMLLYMTKALYMVLGGE